MDQELIDMVDMYTNICTRQEEKFDFWRRNGCPWTWQDCEAAFELMLQTTTGKERFNMMCTSTRRHWKLTEHQDILRVLRAAKWWRTN